MSDNEKILMYNVMKKSPVKILALNILLPSSGYALLDNELVYRDLNSFKSFTKGYCNKRG